MPEPTRSELVSFIQNAELAWEDVIASAERKSIILRGDHYFRLPMKFSTRSKVVAYFRKYWSTLYSTRMFCATNARSIRGRLYIPAGDAGPLPQRVVRLTILSRAINRLVVKAVLQSSDFEKQTVVYTISRNTLTGKLTIVLRSSPDYRYRPCD